MTEVKVTDQESILDVLELKSRMLLREDIDIDNRVIHLRGAINQKSCDKFNRSLSFLESIHEDGITVIVNSPGGDVYSAFAIVDRIQNSPNLITTIGTGLVASAAIPILASGDVRKATRNVSMMYHEPSFNMPFDRLTTAEIETKHVKQLSQRFNKFMAETTKMPYSYWTSIGKHVDFYFDADKALEIGLLDEVIQSGRSS